jgi:23S rRNA (uracil1939-C5)-methyltransferase
MTSTEVTIESLGQRGDGIASCDGKFIHVAKVLPGERVHLRDGKLDVIRTASPERVTPFCKAYAYCSGCKLQHWKETNYRVWKRSLVETALAAAGIETQVGELVDAHGDGRRRVAVHVREIEGQWRAGFMAEGSHQLRPLDVCPVLVRQLADAMAIAARFGPVLGPCDVALTASNHGLDVAIKAERKVVEKRLSILQKLFDDAKLCRLSVNGDSVFTRMTPAVTMGKAQVALPVQSFLQATTSGEEAIAAAVCGILRKSKSIADLFCGVGPFTFRLAEQAKVFAADADRAGVLCLLQATRNTQGLKPVTAVTRDLFKNPIVVSELNEFDGVVIDPPRAGALAQAQMLAKSKVKRIASVSCDLTTFIRDAKVLIEGGYKLTQVTTIDQFKWTHHVEMVGEFVR